MKEAVYSFSNSAGDKFYLRLAADSELFLSKELTSFLKEKDFELWGIYLERLGDVQIYRCMWQRCIHTFNVARDTCRNSKVYQ